MALTSYTTLKASIANWLNRSDLTSEIQDDFIKLTEADLNSKLRVRSMITQANITIDAETASLPTDFLFSSTLFCLAFNLEALYPSESFPASIFFCNFSTLFSPLLTLFCALFSCLSFIFTTLTTYSLTTYWYW